MNNQNLPDNPDVVVQKANKTGLFTNYIYKAIPLAFDESMSYYETLCGLLNYLQNTIIPTVNNNADAVIELQNLYNELHNYVEHYFDNLDVQEEINNKLDEMAESGELQEIMGAYLNTKAIFGFDNVTSMKEASNLINGSYAKTLGYYSKNDGGGATYKIRTITNDDVVDDMFIIELNDNTLIAELIINENTIIAEQVGIKSDDTLDQTTKIQALLNKAIELKNNIHFGPGTFAFSGIITIPETQYGIEIKGNGGYSTKIKTLTNSSQLLFSNFLRYKLNDLYFVGTGQEEIPLIYLNGASSMSEINNCFMASNMGIKIDNAAYLNLNHCSFTLINGYITNYLINIKGEYVYANNCYFEGQSLSVANSKAVIITHGQEFYFNNCDFCNWTLGTALTLDSSNGSIKNIHVTKSTFVRNQYSVQTYCDNGISNFNLDENEFILLTGNELKIFNNERRSGTNGIFNYLKGTNAIDGSSVDTTKQMLTSNGLISNCSLGFSSTIGFPDYDTGFRVKIYASFPGSVTISPDAGQTSKKFILNNNSPYRDYNLPTITPIKYNGLLWTDYTIANTYHGELSITFNYSGTGAYTQAYYKISDY